MEIIEINAKSKYLANNLKYQSDEQKEKINLELPDLSMLSNRELRALHNKIKLDIQLFDESIHTSLNDYKCTKKTVDSITREMESIEVIL